MDLRIATLGVAAAVAMAGGLMTARSAPAQPPRPAAVFTADGRLEFPADYREWVYLSSGFDMSYAEGNMASGDNHVFDNVFVDRAAHAHFLETGRWPEGAVFVLEIRRAAQQGSINKAGRFQTAVGALEVHVKDRRFPSGWAFFAFRGQGPAAPLPQTSACNTCHQDHAAVDTTFVQFYPTLLPVAQARKTLSAAYLAAENAR